MNNANAFESWFVESGNFVKLRELALRYSLDARIVDAFFGGRVTGVELNLIWRNLLTFTKILGLRS